MNFGSFSLANLAGMHTDGVRIITDSVQNQASGRSTLVASDQLVKDTERQPCRPLNRMAPTLSHSRCASMRHYENLAAAESAALDE